VIATETFLHDWTGRIDAPLHLVAARVKPEWVDDYNHLNMAHYLTICDQATWAFWNWVNAPAQTIEAREGHEYVVVESHIIYSGELVEGEAFRIETQLTDVDEKRIILFNRVLNPEGNLAATNEVKCLAFNLETRRPEAWQGRVGERLRVILDTHAKLSRPAQSGQGIALKKK
jgi:YbgC/YbaW family acyl-CoA thioester hydrolase